MNHFLMRKCVVQKFGCSFYRTESTFSSETHETVSRRMTTTISPHLVIHLCSPFARYPTFYTLMSGEPRKLPYLRLVVKIAASMDYYNSYSANCVEISAIHFYIEKMECPAIVPLEHRPLHYNFLCISYDISTLLFIWLFFTFRVSQQSKPGAYNKISICTLSR